MTTRLASLTAPEGLAGSLRNGRALAGFLTSLRASLAG